MPWSFGFVVMLVCLLILLACGAVKMLFKRGMRLRAVRVRGKDRGGPAGHCPPFWWSSV